MNYLYCNFKVSKRHSKAKRSAQIYFMSAAPNQKCCPKSQLEQSQVRLAEELEGQRLRQVSFRARVGRWIRPLVARRLTPSRLFDVGYVKLFKTSKHQGVINQSINI